MKLQLHIKSYRKLYFFKYTFIWLALCLVAAFQTSFAQSNSLTIRKLSIKQGQADIEFPIVNLYNNQAASKKLNEFLQIDIAERTLAKCNEEDLFNQILFSANDTNHHGFLENLTYQATQQNQALLSLTFWGSTIAAYPDYFESAYNFNAATGDILYLEDLCNQDGLKKLKEEVRNQRLKKIASHVAELKKDPEFKTEFESDDADFIENLFSECMSYPTYNDFFIKHDSIHFQSPRCLPHAYQAMDGNFAVGFPLKKIESFLNSYGKKILMLQQPVFEAYHASIFKRPL
ncbi:MAG: hypothetical protein KA198_04740, partial [Chitinophagaceae bacterium]|nr:hypothetical protein [Chitinophagaceae bacterium]